MSSLRGSSIEPGMSFMACKLCEGLTQLTDRGTPPRYSAYGETPLLPPTGGVTLVSATGLSELRALPSSHLDFRKLIRLCEELNSAYGQGCYMATIMLTRGLLDHVPPAFGKANSRKL
jgi:hypothetical protein